MAVAYPDSLDPDFLDNEIMDLGKWISVSGSGSYFDPNAAILLSPVQDFNMQYPDFECRWCGAGSKITYEVCPHCGGPKPVKLK